MGVLEGDTNDLPGIVMFVVGTIMYYGWLNPSIPFFGNVNVDLLTFTADGYTTVISVGMLVTFVGLAWILITNELGFRALSWAQFGMLFVIIWLVLSPPFVPIMGALLTLEWAQMFAFAIQTTAVGLLSYLG